MKDCQAVIVNNADTPRNKRSPPPSCHTPWKRLKRSSALTLVERLRSHTSQIFFPAKHSLLSLPLPILEIILSYLHVTDLLQCQTVSSYINSVIRENASIWKWTSFRGAWPSPPNLQYFQRASLLNNLEASLKLALAHLYKDGLPARDATTPAEHAARYLDASERASAGSAPFTWLFYRPPWNDSVSCCKFAVCDSLLRVAEDPERAIQLDPASLHGLAIVGELGGLRDSPGKIYETLGRGSAAHRGSPDARLGAWRLKHGNIQLGSCDQLKGEVEYQMVRELREIVTSTVHSESHLELSKLYAQERYGGLDRLDAYNFTRSFFMSSITSNLKSIYQPSYPTCLSKHRITNSMRYILVDWLIEVSTVKGFSTHIVHQTINMMDMCFQANPSMPRNDLQLLGVTCLIITARMNRESSSIITIREACWLTDTTYCYSEVVRMMAEVIVYLRGSLTWVTVDEYVDLICDTANFSDADRSMAYYIAELCLLHVDISKYSRGETSAACVVLASLINKREAWSDDSQSFTGFTLSRLRQSVLHIHEKCFVESPPRDHHGVVLESIKLRYAIDCNHFVSEQAELSREALLAAMGDDLENEWTTNTSLRLRVDPYLIMSPSRGSHLNHITLTSEREQAATPIPSWPPRELAETFDEKDGRINQLKQEIDGASNKQEVDDLSFVSFSEDESDHSSNDTSIDDDEDEVRAAPIPPPSRLSTTVSIGLSSPFGALPSSLVVNKSGIHITPAGTSTGSVGALLSTSPFPGASSTPYFTRSHSSTNRHETPQDGIPIPDNSIARRKIPSETPAWSGLS